MPQIFDVIANENARYKRNELELSFLYHIPSTVFALRTLFYYCVEQASAMLLVSLTRAETNFRWWSQPSNFIANFKENRQFYISIFDKIKAFDYNQSIQIVKRRKVALIVFYLTKLTFPKTRQNVMRSLFWRRSFATCIDSQCCRGNSKLGDNTFVIEWFAGINFIILWSQISFYRDASAER